MSSLLIRYHVIPRKRGNKLPDDASQRLRVFRDRKINQTFRPLQNQKERKKERKKEEWENTGRQRVVSCFHNYSFAHNIEHALWPLAFFFFCFGGWSTTLIAASKTPFTFCGYIMFKSTLIIHNCNSITLVHSYQHEYLLSFWAAFDVFRSTNQLLKLLSLDIDMRANYIITARTAWK